VACWCAFVKATSCRHRIVVLQHPREARETFGTARILRRVLPQIELYVGVNFSAEDAAPMLDDPLRSPMLLFPGPLADVLGPEPAADARTIVVLDARWTQARHMFAMNDWLRTLPARRLALDRPSVYTLREQPSPDSLCTVEAVAEAVAILDGDGAVRDALLAPLQAMTGLQEASHAAGSSAVLADRARLVRDGYLPESD
jgi:DTW domain-containing protein YfiP